MLRTWFRSGAVVVGGVTALFFAAAASAVGDPAPPGSYTPRPTDQISVPAPASLAPDDSVVCAAFANKPNYSGGSITGTGGISSCTPHAPYSCASETTVQIYLSGPGSWEAAGASTRQLSCPPPTRSTTAVVHCSPASSTYSYRTEALVTVVYGNTATNTAYSAQLNVACL
jgi:hypothetical protein